MGTFYRKLLDLSLGIVETFKVLSRGNKTCRLCVKIMGGLESRVCWKYNTFFVICFALIQDMVGRDEFVIRTTDLRFFHQNLKKSKCLFVGE